MTITEILDELPKLTMEERHLLIDRLTELEVDRIAETPEMLAALDEGIHAAEQGGGISIEEARRQMSSAGIKVIRPFALYLRQPPIHKQLRPRHITAVITGQKNHCLRDLVRQAEPAHRHRGRDHLPALLARR